MKERMIPSTCPHCGHVFQIKRDTVVIAGMNPTIDKRLNQGTYFTHECQLCHHLYCIEQPFLYRDPDKKYILLLSNQKEINNLPKDEEVIRCKNALQFLFCYKVKSQGLNISLVLKKKRQLEKKFAKPVRFDCWDEKHACLWFWVDQDCIATPLNTEESKQIKG